jgi:hypothetical protein
MARFINLSNIKTNTFLANCADIAPLDQPADLVIPSLSTFFNDPIYNSNIQIKNTNFKMHRTILKPPQFIF